MKGFNSQVIGRDHNYGYNGIEESNELGNNMLEMDLRQYDPAIVRWVIQDPITHHNYSPYQAFDNNPIFWADPSGADGLTLQDLNGNWNTISSGSAVRLYTASDDTEDGGDGEEDDHDSLSIEEQILEGMRALSYEIGQRNAKKYIDDMENNRVTPEVTRKYNSFEDRDCAYYIEAEFPKYIEVGDNSVNYARPNLILSTETVYIDKEKVVYEQMIFVKRTPQEYNVYSFITQRGLIGMEESSRRFASILYLKNLQGENIAKYIFLDENSYNIFMNQYHNIPANQGFYDYAEYYNKINGTSYYQNKK